MEEMDAQPPSKASIPPQWDLQQLFNHHASGSVTDQIRALEKNIRTFAEDYKTKTGSLCAQELLFAIKEYENIQESLIRLQGLHDLSKASGDENRFFSPSDLKKIATLPERISFFTAEINQLSEEVLYDRLQNPLLQKYMPWVVQIRALQHWQLTDAAENYLHLKSPTTHEGWRAFYDLVLDGIKVNNNGQKMTLQEGLDFLRSDADSAQRMSVFKQIAQALKKNESAITLVTNSLAQLHQMEDAWRGFHDPREQQYAQARMDAAVVDRMIDLVRDSYGGTVHRYYAWKSEKKDASRLSFAERDADLFGQDSPVYSWDAARRMVVGAFYDVSPDAGIAAEKILNSGHVNATMSPGKLGAEFVKAVVADQPPFVSCHFDGSARSVRRLARLMGQAVQLEMSRDKGVLMQAPPPVLAEMVGVWAETAVFELQMTAAQNPETRRALLVERTEDMLEKVVRPVVLATFENAIHAEYRKKGELSADEIAEIWLNARKQSYGSAVNLEGPDTKVFWMLERDFIHEPFASYTKAFGEYLVSGVGALFKFTRASRPDHFDDLVKDFLSCGGTKRYDHAISNLGVDINKEVFLPRAVQGVKNMVDRLIDLDQTINPPTPGIRPAPKPGLSS